MARIESEGDTWNVFPYPQSGKTEKPPLVIFMSEATKKYFAVAADNVDGKEIVGANIYTYKGKPMGHPIAPARFDKELRTALSAEFIAACEKADFTVASDVTDLLAGKPAPKKDPVEVQMDALFSEEKLDRALQHILTGGTPRTIPDVQAAQAREDAMIRDEADNAILDAFKAGGKEAAVHTWQERYGHRAERDATFAQAVERSRTVDKEAKQTALR